MWLFSFLFHFNTLSHGDVTAAFRGLDEYELTNLHHSGSDEWLSKIKASSDGKKITKVKCKGKHESNLWLTEAFEVQNKIKIKKGEKEAA